MQQHGTPVNFARFTAFVRDCRVEPTQPQRRNGLAESLGLEPGEDDRFVAAYVLDGAQATGRGRSR